MDKKTPKGTQPSEDTDSHTDYCITLFYVEEDCTDVFEDRFQAINLKLYFWTLIHLVH